MKRHGHRLAVLLTATLGLARAGELHAQSDDVHVDFASTNANSFISQTSGNTLQFWVKYLVNDPQTADPDDFVLTCTNGTGVTVTDCASAWSPAFIAPDDSVLVTVTFSTTAYTGPSSVMLTATGTFTPHEGTGSDAFTVAPAWDVSVVSGQPTVQRHSATPGHQASFTVKNTGGQTNSYSLACAHTGPLLGCGAVTPSSQQLVPGQEIGVTVDYDVVEMPGVTGVDSLYLRVTGTSVADSAYHIVEVLDGQVAVTPDGLVSDPVTTSQQASLTFTVSNTGQLENTFSLTCSGQDLGCTHPQPVTVPGGQSTNVSVSFTAGATPATGSLSLTASGQGGATDQGSYEVPIQGPGGGGGEIGVALGTNFGDVAAATSQNNVVKFWITNNQTSGVSNGNLVVNCTPTEPTVQNCIPVGGSTIQVYEGQSEEVTFHLDMTAEQGPGSVSLTVTDLDTDVDGVGTFDLFMVWLHQSAVSVVGGPSSAYVGQAVEISYQVTNTGGIDADFALSCEGCASVTPQVLNDLAVGQPANVTVSFTGSEVVQGHQVQLTSTVQYPGGVGSHESSATQVVDVYALPEVQVVPKHATLVVTALAADTADFTVTYDNDTLRTFQLEPECTGSLTGCPASLAPVLVSASQPAVVRVPFQAGADGTQGEVRLTATRDGVPEVTATGKSTIVAQSGLTVDPGSANPGLEELRAECVSISAGAGAIECDDYRFTYPLVPVARLNRARSTGLGYNSATIHPRKVVGANVTIPKGTAPFDSLVAELRVGGVVRDRFSIRGPLLASLHGAPVRVALELDDYGATTGLVRYQVVAELYAGGSVVRSGEGTGHLVWVDRKEEFGRGWWIQGYERLAFASDSVLGDVVLWTGGDASTRVYQADTTASNRWIATSRGRTDTIVAPGPPPPDPARFLSISGDEQGTLPAGSYSSLTGASQMTWAFWIKPTAGGASDGNIASIWSPWSNERRWWLFRSPSNHKLYLVLGNSQASWAQAGGISSTALAVGTWYFVVIQFDGTQTVTTNRVKMWVNGVPESVSYINAANIPTSIASGQPKPFSVGSGVVTGVNAELGEFGILGGVLSTGAIADWYANGIDFSHPGYLAAYKMQDNLTDLGPLGNHLTPVNIDPSEYGTTTAYPSRSVSSPGGAYVRKLLGGGEVHYDAAGRHIKTVDRNGNETVFGHATIGSEVRLASIALPTKTGPSEAYRFHYDGATLELDFVQVVGGDGGWLNYSVATTLTGAGLDGFTIDAITAPDGLSVTLGYSNAEGQLASIVDPRGAVTTIEYGHQKVAKVEIDTPGDPSISLLTMPYQAHSVVGIDTVGVHAPRAADSVSAAFDGARDDVPDVTRFFVTGWGAVRGVRDALGHETWVERTDSLWPALPTKVRYANGREVTATYYGDGLLNYTEDLSTGGVTSYTWDTRWSRVKSVTTPEGVVSEFDYDAATGNRMWQRVGADTVRFAYDPQGLMESLRSAEGHTTSLGYDGSGNLRSQRTPLGFVTLSYKDFVGRDTVVVDSVPETGQASLKRYMYDVMGRDTLEVTVAPGGAESSSVRTVYDAFKDPERIERSSTGASAERVEALLEPGESLTLPDVGELPAIVREFDGLGRIKAESNDGGARWRTMVFDNAGNPTEVTTPRGLTVRVSYDALNRRDTVIVPQSTNPALDCLGGSYTQQCGWGFPERTLTTDTLLFEYDAVGNLRRAYNRDAHVDRTYYQSGQLHTETTQIRRFGSPLMDSYETRYSYDRDGRAVRIDYPAAISAGADFATYEYHPLTGRLDRVTNVLGTSHTFGYDKDGRVTSVAYGTGANEVRRYDPDGRLTYRKAGPVIEDSLVYDSRNRVIQAISLPVTNLALNEYAPIGPISESVYSRAGSMETERFVTDPLGFLLMKRNPVDATPAHEPMVYHDYSGGRLEAIRAEGPLVPQDVSSYPWYVEYGYDNAGNQKWQSGSNSVTSPETAETEISRRATRSYYDAEERLRYIETKTRFLGQFGLDSIRGVREEYRYDALGRRVAIETRSDADICDRPALCYNARRYFIWSGDQLIAEKSDSIAGSGRSLMNQYGSITYTHAGDLDRPLDLVRNGAEYVPHLNWRGLYAGASNSTGQGYSGDVIWPGNWRKTFGDIDDQEPPVGTWFGSLVADQQDVSGLLYRRNRYYDPRSGQFTQEDPIGIAGGLNLYGYANGDPINFSDPFGLFACPPLCDSFDPENDNFIRPESGSEALALGGMAVGAAVGGAVLGAAGALAAGETILAAGTEAVGPLITSEKAAAVARVALASNAGQQLTRVFTGENFRLGVSRAADGGRFVLRAAGNTVQRILGRPKLDIMDLGKIEDFMKALGRR